MAPPPGEPPTLAALRAQRAELRSRIAGVQAEIDDLPVQPLDHPEASAAWEVRLAELTTERDALVATSRQLDQAIRALEETDQARATKAAGSNLEASLKSLVARLQVVEDEADRLPCALARAAATAAAGNQSSTARAWVQGARACDEAGARGAGCRFQTAPWCSAARADELYEAVAKNIGNACPPAPAGSFAGRIAAKHRRLLTAHFRRGQDRQPLDPKGFDSFAVAEGFYARRQATVTTRAGDVALTGLETALVFYGPTGTGKTLAACYLLARWGGVYMTAYDLAGVGQDPTCPSRTQLLAAPVLVVDQLGRQQRGASDYASVVLEKLIDQRYAEERVTVLAGNYDSLADLEEDLGEVCASRLAEIGLVVQCLGEDARRAPKGSAAAGRR
jgi:DNA replication protein DnaC